MFRVQGGKVLAGDLPDHVLEEYQNVICQIVDALSEIQGTLITPVLFNNALIQATACIIAQKIIHNGCLDEDKREVIKVFSVALNTWSSVKDAEEQEE
jgi:hypothetical protein